MMKRNSLALLLLVALATPAQALKLVVWDPELKSKVAYGESSGGRFNVKYDKDYEGPVVALFSQTDEEKARTAYPALRSSYVGILKDGQLFISEDSTLRNIGSGTSLARLLQPYKFNVNLQPTSQALPLSNSYLAAGERR